MVIPASKVIIQNILTTLLKSTQLSKKNYDMVCGAVVLCGSPFNECFLTKFFVALQ